MSYYSYSAPQPNLSAYTRVQTLGKGSFGQVHLVKSSSGTLYAQKETDLAGVSTAARQAAVLEPELHMIVAKHPNVVGYIESETTDRKVTIVMEYCTGGTLAERRAKDKSTWSEKQVLAYFGPLCLALKHCHDCSVVHRDIKPDNVFLTTVNGVEQVRLGDFGLSCRIKPGYYDVIAAGTPACSSPEISSGQPYRASTDVWSLGVVLYWMLSGGRMPFHGKNKEEMKRNITDTEPPALPTRVSEGLRSLVAQMLLKNEAQRPTVAQIIAHDMVASALTSGALPPKSATKKASGESDSEEKDVEPLPCYAYDSIGESIKRKMMCTKLFHSDSESDSEGVSGGDVAAQQQQAEKSLQLSSLLCSPEEEEAPHAEEEHVHVAESTAEEDDSSDRRWAAETKAYLELRAQLQQRITRLMTTDDAGIAAAARRSKANRRRPALVVAAAPAETYKTVRALNWSRRTVQAVIQAASTHDTEEGTREETDSSSAGPPPPLPPPPVFSRSNPSLPTVTPITPSRTSRSETTTPSVAEVSNSAIRSFSRSSPTLLPTAAATPIVSLGLGSFWRASDFRTEGLMGAAPYITHTYDHR